MAVEQNTGRLLKWHEEMICLWSIIPVLFKPHVLPCSTTWFGGSVWLLALAMHERSAHAKFNGKLSFQHTNESRSFFECLPPEQCRSMQGFTALWFYWTYAAERTNEPRARQTRLILALDTLLSPFCLHGSRQTQLHRLSVWCSIVKAFELFLFHWWHPF